MSRPPPHKALVDAIIDGEVSAKELATRASELGPALGGQMMKVTRAIMRARAKGAMTFSEARKMYVEAYHALSLAAFARVAHELVDKAQSASDAVHAEAKKIENLSEVAPIRKADFLAREAEKANG